MSKIEWTNVTWNPVTGCNKVSQGCKFCYAEIMHRRLRGMFPKKYSKPFLGGVEVHADELDKPLKWKKPRMVFVNSMSDLFHKDVPLEFIAKVFAVMFLAEQHTFQVLTKRADRLPELATEYFRELFYKYINILHDQYIKPLEQEMYQYREALDALPLPNVWIGVSCEDQAAADQRIPFLIQVPAAVRFLSCEPLLGPIDLDAVPSPRLEKFNNSKVTLRKINYIDWVITGGESGHHARLMHPDWVRSFRDQCAAAGVPFFFKQWGQWEPDSHVSFNGPFFIRSRKHYIVDINGKSWPHGNGLNINRKPLRYTKEEDLLSDQCPLTKKDNAWWMANTGKSKSGNFLDGKQHLEFPSNTLTPIQ